MIGCTLTHAQYNLWTIGTAKTLQPKSCEIGVFSPLRYGINHKVEVQTFILPFVLTPNVRFKIHWFTTRKWEILVATRHAVYYPTLGMNIIYKKEPLGIDWLNEKYSSSEFYEPTRIVNTFTFANELLLSKMLIPKTSCTPPNLLLTLKLGIANSVFTKKEHHIPKINKPMLYQRTAVLHDSVLWYIGLDLDGHINSFLDFSVDIEFLSVDWGVKDYNIEHKGLLIMPIGSFRLAGGYQLAYGSYPEKKKFFAMPLIELVYRFDLHRVQNGLFRNDPYKRSMKERNKRKAI